MAVAIDTNILIRYITNDDTAKAERAKRFIDRVVQQEEECVLCESVLAEVIWVLSHPRTYNLTREETVDFLDSFISLDGVRINPKSVYRRSVEMYKTSKLDFPDCVLAALVESGRATHLATFDTEIADSFPVHTIEL